MPGGRSLRTLFLMDNLDLARAFDETGDLLELEGANPFRVRAYRNAARTITDLTESVATLAGQGTAALTELPGIGDDLAKKIVTIVETEKLPQLDELRQKVPAGVVEMLRIPGLGPKKAAALFKELNIQSLDQLREAAEKGAVAKLKGFGAKTAKSILEGLSQIEQLGQLIELASKPIPVRLESDQITSVTLYRVGSLGVFASKELELRPGTYTVIGSRDGYRDVRQTFTVRPGRNLPPISVVCVEPI